MTVDSWGAVRLLGRLCLAMPIACAAHDSGQPAASAGPATPRTGITVDDFGLPLPPAGGQGAAGMTAIERWKREAVALGAQEKRVDGPHARFGADEHGNAYHAFGAAFAEAKVPDCLREDGLKRQPPRIGFFVFQGVLALPFVALAKVRGKCL
jgi:hypothetical protein